MTKGDDIFGAPRENAARLLAPNERGPILFEGRQYTYEDAMALHLELGQALARGMRLRGSSPPPDGDIGGTPMALAA
jgi:hypothetical protein